MTQELIINNKSYKKAESLEALNMFKGQLYETIVTTQSNESIKNAAPIGVICKDSNHIVIHLDNCGGAKECRTRGMPITTLTSTCR